MIVTLEKMQLQKQDKIMKQQDNFTRLDINIQHSSHQTLK